jgi:hypothetical protein
MIKYEDKKEFKLSNKLNYQHNGSVMQCETLDMFAPSRAQSSEVFKLKQFYFKAQSDLATRFMPMLKNLQENKDKLNTQQDNGEDLEGQTAQVLQTIYTSDIDMNDFIKSFCDLAKKGAVKTPAGAQMTDLLLDSLSLQDIERLLGEYLVFFIVNSTAKAK